MTDEGIAPIHPVRAFLLFRAMNLNIIKVTV